MSNGSKQRSGYDLSAHVPNERFADVLEVRIGYGRHSVGGHDPLCELIRCDGACVRDKVINVKEFAILHATATAQPDANLVQ
jgi:hypothetical protein